MLRLYDFVDSGNGYKVRLLLRQLGRPFERVDVDILHGGSRTDAFLAKNLNGRIPVLELESGEHLPESNAILFFLAEGTHYLPEGALQRARVLQRVLLGQCSGEANSAASRWELEHVEVGEARDFFVEGRYSISDIALFAYTHVADEGGFDLGPLAHVRAWLERVRNVPGFVPMAEA